MTVMDNGFIEIGNIMTRASSEVINKLKSILDQHGIYHISDGDTFYSPHRNGASGKAILQGRFKEGIYSQNDLCRNKRSPTNLEKYQTLIVPDLYALNFISLIFLDPEEAKFLATLIYEAPRLKR